MPLSALRTGLGALLLAAPLYAEPTVSKIKWRDFDAYHLTDERTEAIVVPRLGGRLMHYGRIDGANWIWNGEAGAEKRNDALMWGGDKTYIGPHTMWNFTQAKTWPPPGPDVVPHEIVKAPNALLATVSAEWPGYRTRVTREYAFDNGELVIRHGLAAVASSQQLAAKKAVSSAPLRALSFNRNTGAFSGRMQIGRKSVKFSGAVNQQGNIGAGQFILGGETGAVIIQP